MDLDARCSLRFIHDESEYVTKLAQTKMYTWEKSNFDGGDRARRNNIPLSIVLLSDIVS